MAAGGDSLFDLHTLWIGPPLRWFERLCLTSMLAQGHRVVLWCYQPVENVPDGVVLAPAREVLPETAIIRHRKQDSLALFSNRFRYRLLQMHAVTWVDIDMLFLRPLTDESPLLFGAEDANFVCGAVLRLPRRHPALNDLERLSLARVPVPFWWPWRERWRQRLAGLVGRHVAAEDMRWGTFGPRALTYALRRHGCEGLTRPPEVFYPVHYRQAPLPFGAPADVERLITANTIAVHLWSDSSQGPRRDSPPAQGSWLAAMCERFGVAV
jgi:alpha 1,4-glycosyltransferase